MTFEPSKSDELFDLCSELADGELAPARKERLRELLRDDPEAQDLYLAFMRIHTQLHLDYGHTSGSDDLPGSSCAPLDTRPDLSYGSILESTLDAEFTAQGPVHVPARFWPAASAIGWTLAVVLAIGLAAALRTRGPARKPAPLTNHRPLAKVSLADGVAVVVRAGSRWEMDDGQVPAEGDILPRGRLRLQEGRAILSMLSGVSVIVEGPADLELLSIDRIACHRGKVRARVPDGAEGFVVSGPGSAVVDLGTEFGVNVKSDGRSRGKVFEGQVEAAVLGQTGVLRSSRVVQEQSDAFEIDPESGLIGPLKDPEDFISPLRPTVASLVLAPGYRASVLASRPKCYWRFESAAENKVDNEIAGEPALLVNGPIRMTEIAPGNHCAALADGQPDQRLMMDGLWKPARTPGYAVELWFLSETISQAALVSMIAPRDTTQHLSLVELTSSNRLTLFPPATVRFLYRWPTGRGGGENTFSTSIYVPYRWHHVVAQVDGERMELFLDGVRQTAQPIGPGGSTTACQLIVGRLTTLAESKDLHHTGFRRPFVGLLDELALYDHPLADEEIRARFQLVRPAIDRASPVARTHPAATSSAADRPTP